MEEATVFIVILLIVSYLHDRGLRYSEVAPRYSDRGLTDLFRSYIHIIMELILLCDRALQQVRGGVRLQVSCITTERSNGS